MVAQLHKQTVNHVRIKVDRYPIALIHIKPRINGVGKLRAQGFGPCGIAFQCQKMTPFIQLLMLGTIASEMLV